MINNKNIRLSELKDCIPEENIKFMKFRMSEDEIETFIHVIKTMVVRYRAGYLIF